MKKSKKSFNYADFSQDINIKKCVSKKYSKSKNKRNVKKEIDELISEYYDVETRV